MGKLKTLVLDLMKLLIHSTTSSCSNFDFMVQGHCLIMFTSALIWITFLAFIFGGSDLHGKVREYADPVIDLIDENRRLFKTASICSDYTKRPPSHYLKDLSKIELDISKMCL